MTPEEREQIFLFATTYFRNNCALIFVSGLTGAYLLAFAISMHILLKKTETGRAHKAMILLILIGCGLVMLYLCTNFIPCLMLVDLGLVVSLPSGLEAQGISANSHAAAIFIPEEISGNLMYLLADTIIIWRAWAIWTESRVTRLCLIILVLADMGTTIADDIIDAGPVGLHTNDSTAWDWIAAAMNLAVNAITTLLIVHRAWKHHNSMDAVSHGRKSRVQAILLLLIESGAAFAAVQVLIIVIAVLDVNAITGSPLNIATPFLTSLYVISAALNPVAIVILVHTKNTHEHSFHLADVPSLTVHSIEVADGLLEIDQ